MLVTEKANEELENNCRSTSQWTEDRSNYRKGGMQSLMLGLHSSKNGKVKCGDSRNKKPKGDSSVSMELDTDETDQKSKVMLGNERQIIELTLIGRYRQIMN